MKKHIIKIGLVVFATFLTLSCNDDFLDRQPLDEISNESFWNTENDLMVYNNGLYHIARSDLNVPILMAFDAGFSSHRYTSWNLDNFSDNIAHAKEINIEKFFNFIARHSFHGTDK